MVCKLKKGLLVRMFSLPTLSSELPAKNKQSGPECQGACALLESRRMS
ncbi:hypothetical protein DOT_3703 [Desulfosporosinus sp. OT]|nr:hypothetical protein DOT_3703 [Desulfosporosinus sp. OT]